jgi:hypothetical protein
VAKEKKKLMIPFTYYYEEMMDYADYNYEEGTENSSKIWWDTELKRKLWQPNPPYKPSDIYSGSGCYYGDSGKERWVREKEEYPTLLEKYNKAWDDFNVNISVGKIIKVDDIVWKENFEFEDTLELTGMSRGRSAANFNLKSITDGKNYNLFMTDTVDLIQNSTINKGKITGRWTFCKRGQNYGVKIVKEK